MRPQPFRPPVQRRMRRRASTEQPPRHAAQTVMPAVGVGPCQLGDHRSRIVLVGQYITRQHPDSTPAPTTARQRNLHLELDRV